MHAHGDIGQGRFLQFEYAAGTIRARMTGVPEVNPIRTGEAWDLK